MERRSVISGKMTAVIGMLLLLLIGITAALQRNSLEADGRTLVLYQDGEAVSSISLKELMAMESTEVSVLIQSVKNGQEQGEYRGVWLTELLKQAGISEYDTVILSAGDGYSAAASKKEADTILIAYAQDGDTLGYYTQGDTGPMRAVFTEDTYGNRSVQYLTRIDVRTR